MLLKGVVSDFTELLGDFTELLAGDFMELLPGDEPKLIGEGFGFLAG